VERAAPSPPRAARKGPHRLPARRARGVSGGGGAGGGRAWLAVQAATDWRKASNVGCVSVSIDSPRTRNVTVTASPPASAPAGAAPGVGAGAAWGRVDGPGVGAGAAWGRVDGAGDARFCCGQSTSLRITGATWGSSCGHLMVRAAASPGAMVAGRGAAGWAEAHSVRQFWEPPQTRAQLEVVSGQKRLRRAASMVGLDSVGHPILSSVEMAIATAFSCG
jgi:hypothetical protein